MKILITGGCGFIGQNLIRTIANDPEYDFIIYDNLSVGKIEDVNQWRDKVIVGDITHKDDLIRASKDCDAIVHLAAFTNVIESIENPETCIEQNVTGTFNVLEACRINDINKFVLASSNAAVGEKDPPIREDMIPAPLSVYGMSKLSGEALCSAYYHSYGIQTIALRFANVYGPYSTHKSSVVAKFIRRIKNNHPLIIYGDGNQTRDFVHVNDIVRGILLALHADIGGRIFQVGSGVETSILQFVDLLKNVVNGITFKVEFAPPRKGEILRNYTDYTLAKNELGFEPQMQLKNGLKEVWNWYL